MHCAYSFNKLYKHHLSFNGLASLQLFHKIIKLHILTVPSNSTQKVTTIYLSQMKLLAVRKAFHACSHWNTLKGIYLDLRNGIKNSFEVKWTTMEGTFPNLKMDKDSYVIAYIVVLTKSLFMTKMSKKRKDHCAWCITAINTHL